MKYFLEKLHILPDTKTANCDSMEDLANKMKQTPMTYTDINDDTGILEAEFIKKSKKTKEESEVLVMFSKKYIEYFEKLETAKPFMMSLDATFAVVPRLKGVYQMLTIMIKHESRVYAKS